MLAPLVESRTAQLAPLERSWVLTLYGVNRVFAGRPRDAQAPLREAVALAAALRDSALLGRGLRWQGTALQNEGRFAESVPVFRRVVEIADVLDEVGLEGQGHTGLGYAALQSGEYARARGEYERAVEQLRQSGDERGLLIAQTGLGRSYGALGERARAEACFEDVVARARRLGDTSAEGDALNNLGTGAFERGDPAAAQQFFQQALELQRTRGNLSGMVTPASNLALAYLYLGRFNDASAILHEMLGICEANGYRDQEALVLIQLAEVRLNQGRPHESVGLLRRSLAPGAAVPVEQQADGLVALAHVLVKLDSAQAALRLLEARAPALRERIPLRRELHLLDAWADVLLDLGRPREALTRYLDVMHSAQTSGLSREALDAIVPAARCHLALDQPQEALTLLHRARELWESQREREADLQWREWAGSQQRLLYMTLAELMLEHPRDAPREQRARQVFDALQRYKARTLHERMLGPALSTSASRPKPRVPVALGELQRDVLGDGEVFLDFYLGPRSSVFFAVTRDAFCAVRLPGADSTLGPRIQLFRDLLVTAAAASVPSDALGFIGEAGSQLGTVLLAPAADLIRTSTRVIVAPDGMLNLIPLGMLTMAERDGAASPLLMTREVVNVPSATVLAVLREQERVPSRPGASQTIVALAGTRDEAGRHLPGAEREVRWLASHFAQVLVQGPEEDANRMLAQGGLARHGVIHIAAHVRADDQHPWRSGVLVGAGAGQSRDPYLRASSIAAMRLPARLAVLSGCESAGGMVVSGEGVLGLTGAFISAGVPTVVATLWPVSDRATESLMREFYSALARGETAAGALRQAQLALRSEPETRAPFYWAGFVLVGEGGIRVALQRRMPLAAQLGVVLLPMLAAGAAILWWQRRGWPLDSGSPMTKDRNVTPSR